MKAKLDAYYSPHTKGFLSDKITSTTISVTLSCTSAKPFKWCTAEVLRFMKGGDKDQLRNLFRDRAKNKDNLSRPAFTGSKLTIGTLAKKKKGNQGKRIDFQSRDY